jgi:hypothetical protein
LNGRQEMNVLSLLCVCLSSSPGPMPGKIWLVEKYDDNAVGRIRAAHHPSQTHPRRAGSPCLSIDLEVPSWAKKDQ